MEQTKYIVKITIYKERTLPEEVVYYQSNLSLDFVNKWRWYFEYIASLLKVKNPRRPVKTVICQQELLVGKDYIAQKSITLLRAKKSRLNKLRLNTTETDLFGADQQKRDEKKLLLENEIEALERGEFNYWYPVEYINKVKKWTSNDPSDKIKIHCLTRRPGDQTYFFTKDKNHCVCIEYRSEWDFGKGSPSGARLFGIEIHTKNAFVFKNKPEIHLDEVPECILDLLTYLK